MEKGIMSGNRLKTVAMAAITVNHVISAFFIKMADCKMKLDN